MQLGQGPPVACGSLTVNRCPVPEALRLWVHRKHKALGRGSLSPAHGSGIFQTALFFTCHPVACCCHRQKAKPDLEAAGTSLTGEPCEVGTEGRGGQRHTAPSYTRQPTVGTVPPRVRLRHWP